MNEEVREKLATAASQVDGVTVTPYFRSTTTPGQGMVRLGRMARSTNGFGFVNTWQVLIILSSDLAVAEKWLDAHIEGLYNALTPHMTIQSFAPEQIAPSTGNVIPVVLIEGTREQE